MSQVFFQPSVTSRIKCFSSPSGLQFRSFTFSIEQVGIVLSILRDSVEPTSHETLDDQCTISNLSMDDNDSSAVLLLLETG